ncbi:hypothetical protein [Microbacterium pseudoresistens]|uniref:PKD domain-containing protein n=1 Tax=Microbacterium pseudoresistens TaxID=640634 RepID=A0A7Y9EX99_9MICO|nr:hypothetical protein [Microbacterium pseudoresistens]NYD55649.1 hypothetical protein [Microbacterium pseudoresistens]
MNDPGAPGGDPSPAGDPGWGDDPAPDPDDDDLASCLDPWENDRQCFPSIIPGVPEDPDDPLPPITISDLVRFVPTGSISTTEPGNVAVVGLPANTINNAGTEQLTATLLGRTIQVRFTPVSFDFDYGDGTAVSTATGGASWNSLGQAQFTPTATSHVYTARGTYPLAVTIHYHADINTGHGWTPIRGTVTGPPATATIHVFQARTALVDDTCNENPDAPGC